MKCHYCPKTVPVEGAVVVIAPAESRTFCSLDCAGGWAISRKWELSRVAFFASDPEAEKRHNNVRR